MTVVVSFRELLDVMQRRRTARRPPMGRPTGRYKCQSKVNGSQLKLAATKAKLLGYACGSAATGMYIGAGGGVHAGSGTRFAW